MCPIAAVSYDNCIGIPISHLLSAFNQEKAPVKAFSEIVKTDCETDGSSAAALGEMVTPSQELESLFEVWTADTGRLLETTLEKS